MASKKARDTKKVVAPVTAVVPPVISGTFRYGRDWGDSSDLDIELLCFREGMTPAEGGLGKEEHFWNIVSILWPKGCRRPFIRNPWGERMIRAWCKHNFVSVSGCASSSKTDTAAVWSIVNWLCAPLKTKVLVTSTTLRESRKRIWGSIEEYWIALDPGVSAIGKLASSFGIIKLSEASGFKASEKTGIELVPGEKKREREATGKIIGIKNERLFMVADELPELSPAIMQAVLTNWAGANPHVQGIGLGNPASYFDAHGIFATPKAGWKSISVEDDEWETIYGVAIRFDARKSPNILEGDDSLYPWLPTTKKLEDAKRLLGENSYGFFRQWVGWFPPESAEMTVFSDTDIIYFGGTASDVEWAGAPTPVAGHDPGFSTDGDRSIVYFGLLGNDKSTGTGLLLLTDYAVLKEDMRNKAVPRSIQIAREFRRECELRDVAPENAGVDVSGSPAYGDIVANEWSPSVHRTQFGGKSSHTRVGVDRAAAEEVYANKITELWFELRACMSKGQIRGVLPDLANELTARRYERGQNSTGSLGTTLRLEPKAKMKGRTGKSPDIADAALVLFDVCRSRHKLRPLVAARLQNFRKAQWSGFRDRVRGGGSGRAKELFRSLIDDRGGRVRIGRGAGLSLIR